MCVCVCVPAVKPLASHPTNHTSETNETYLALLEKSGQTHKWRSSMDSDIWTHQCLQTHKDLHTSLLYKHQRYSRENLPGAMNDGGDYWERERERERERESQKTACGQNDLMMMGMMENVENIYEVFIDFLSNFNTFQYSFLKLKFFQIITWWSP